MTVMVKRTGPSVDELRSLARRARNVAQARRLLAVASVLEGASRTRAAEAAGMTRQILRDWVHRYNEAGADGLLDRRRPGRPARLSEAQLKELDALVEKGPDIAEHGVVRWRCADLQSVIAQTFAAMSDPKTDEAAQEAFKACPREGGENFAVTVADALPAAAVGKPIEVWFQDEARVGQQGTLTRLWARRGSRPRAVRDTRYEWAYIFGAVCPRRGVGAALVMPYADTEAMNAHLAEISRCGAEGAHAVLVLDGAGWHTAAAIEAPQNITLVILPPYSPELNPVENVWEYLRKNKLANRLYETYQAIVDAGCAAWSDLMTVPGRISSIADRDWSKMS